MSGNCKFDAKVYNDCSGFWVRGVKSLLSTQTGEDGSRSDRPMRPTIASMNKMTPRALKRKASLSQAVSTGKLYIDIYTL